MVTILHYFNFYQLNMVKIIDNLRSSFEENVLGKNCKWREEKNVIRHNKP